MNTIGTSDFYDAEVHRHNVHFRAAAAVRARDRVLDIGCGAGQSTREAARAAVDGSAVGVDVSEAVLERARRLSRESAETRLSAPAAPAIVLGTGRRRRRPRHEGAA